MAGLFRALSGQDGMVFAWEEGGPRRIHSAGRERVSPSPV